MPKRPPQRLALALLAACAAAGCSLTGPQTLETGRPLYNLAVQQTNAEQLLLNLVRLRYRDTPFFLQVASVSANFEIESTGDAAVGLPSGGPTLWNLGLGGRVMESPTVTYTPLQGDDFVKQLLSPISPATLLLLYHSGWSIERVLRVCVQRLNAVRNAPSASGPTPEEAPVYRDFLRAARLARELQKQDRLEIGAVDGDGEELRLRLAPEALESPEWRELARLLELDPRRGEVRLGPGLEPGPAQVRVVTRSLMAALFYTSQGVRVPPRDEAAGRVTLTRTADGQPFDWREVTGDLLQVHWSPRRPDGAAVRARYRDSWFYLDDADLDSKSSFALLSLLLQLQSGEVPSVAPLLTLPVSR